jgi:hypothetical protein
MKSRRSTEESINMTPHISEEFSTRLVDRSLFVLRSNTMPPRNPNEDEEDEDDEDDEEDEGEDDRTEEPPVVREPDED